MDDDNPINATPTPYREVVIELDDVYRGPHFIGEQLKLLVQGAGSSVGGGPWYEGASMSVGEEFVILADQRPFRMREGDITVLTPIREPISVLATIDGPDGSTHFVPQRSAGDGWPLLADGRTIKDRYPDGIPADKLAALTQEFDELPTDPDAEKLFPFIYYPFGREGGDNE